MFFFSIFKTIKCCGFFFLEYHLANQAGWPNFSRFYNSRFFTESNAAADWHKLFFFFERVLSVESVTDGEERFILDIKKRGLSGDVVNVGAHLMEVVGLKTPSSDIAMWNQALPTSFSPKIGKSGRLPPDLFLLFFHFIFLPHGSKM